ncbi:hypothetical protein G9A89_003864 [Geosiphon pyriformis]|nr:hypothetical protein G9A89_003864 [Geosiphon pyriformis]
MKLALRENLLFTPISIPPNTTIQQKLQLCLNEENSKYPPIYRYFYIRKTLHKQKLELIAANLTKKAIQKQLHNKFKITAGSTNSCYKLRAALRLYDLFHICENVLQNPILQSLKIQYIGKLTKLKFQQFSDQISSIILDYYLEITDSTWTLTELSLEGEEIVNGSLPTDPQFFYTTNKILTMEFGHQVCPKSEFSKLFKSTATITKNESLNTIFPFELEESSTMPLFSRAVLEKKPITVMYIDAKVNGHFIKLILNSGLAGSIITKQLMDQLGHQVDHAASARIITADEATKTPIGEIDDFLFEVNGIIIPIKVLVIKATQYQALTTNLTTPLIEFKEEEKKLTWEAYQYLCEMTIAKEKEPAWEWEEKSKEKGKEKKEESISTSTTMYNSYTIPQQSTYHLEWPIPCQLLYIVTSFVGSISAFEFYFVVSSVVVFEFVGADILSEAVVNKWVVAVADKLPVSLVDKLAFDILVVDKVAAVL